MAVLWNETQLAGSPVDERPGPARIPIKRQAALVRSTVRAAFALLESYVNGIAFDIVLTRRSELSAQELEQLTERNAAGNPKFQSLRTKLLQYPKIALRRQHPPIQENNCPAMAYMIEKERDWRDAIMHPTPRVDPERAFPREPVYYAFEAEDAREVVDNTIALIRRIDSELAGMFGYVSLWIYDRDKDGMFPAQAFY